MEVKITGRDGAVDFYCESHDELMELMEDVEKYKPTYLMIKLPYISTLEIQEELG